MREMDCNKRFLPQLSINGSWLIDSILPIQKEDKAHHVCSISLLDNINGLWELLYELYKYISMFSFQQQKMESRPQLQYIFCTKV